MPLVYDVYGTLLDVDAATREAAAEDGMEALAAVAETLSARWRQRQLAQSWLISLMGEYTDFWSITCASLDTTLEELGLTEPKLRSRLLDLYLHLSAYPEVPAELAAMKANGHRLAVLSNGNPAMLDQALASAGITALFDAVLSVEAVGVFKPDARVYRLVTDAFDCPAGEVGFFSSNNWDIAGAGHFGFRTIWVNRAQRCWDAPPPRPWREVTSLKAAHSAFLNSASE